MVAEVDIRLNQIKKEQVKKRWNLERLKRENKFAEEFNKRKLLCKFKVVNKDEFK